MNSSAFHGLLVLDKPRGMTSRAVVDRVQRWFPRGTRIGHTGTLDPLATGVLVVCVGAATRLTEYVQQMAKTYHTLVRLGTVSATDDAEGPLTPQSVERPPERGDIETVLPSFLGEVDQVPPAFSAAKISGQRAYDRARKGEEVSLTPRKVRIDRLNLLSYSWPELELEVHCGKGTYIRSLARDLGERLGCGGMVQTLRRTRVGPFEAEGAVSPEATKEEAWERLLPVLAAVEGLPRTTLPPHEIARFRDGRGVSLPLPKEGPQEWIVLDRSGELFAIAQWDPERAVLLPKKVLGGTKSPIEQER